MKRCSECHKPVPEEGGGYVARASDAYLGDPKPQFVCAKCLNKAEAGLRRAVMFVIYFLFFLSALYMLWGENGLLR